MQIANRLPRSTRNAPRPGTPPRTHDPAARSGDRGTAAGRNTYIVTRERIRAFADITHNNHPIHHSDAVARDYGYPAPAAPPTFAALAMVRAQHDAVRILAPGIGPDALLHTRQTLHIRRLLVAGDVVTTDIRIRSIRATADYASVEAQAVLTDHEGQVVQSGSSSLHVCVPPGAAPPAELLTGIRDTAATAVPEPVKSHDHTMFRPGLPLPRRTFPMRSADPERYAALCTPTRTAPDPHARSGPPPGMMRLALTAGYLSSCLGDPAAVSRYEAEFTHYSGMPGRAVHPVEISGRVIAVDERCAAVVELDGRCLDRRLFIRAHAVLRPPHH
ncbi:FAS1-like dehydratase domain-containing protein [Nocardia sp. CA-290969]|uniref:FAS1-like dehydratase domain-containing protein n=1 Tax=Nocardia sp. CA-290969 TaxID=3239986 RepID=UPI003D8AFE8C